MPGDILSNSSMRQIPSSAKTWANVSRATLQIHWHPMNILPTSTYQLIHIKDYLIYYMIPTSFRNYIIFISDLWLITTLVLACAFSKITWFAVVTRSMFDPVWGLAYIYIWTNIHISICYKYCHFDQLASTLASHVLRFKNKTTSHTWT